MIRKSFTMIPSLRTPKQRIELPSGTAFFNDFANTLHMNRGVTFEHSVMPRNDITVTKLGLQIPSDAESYESFTARIQENEKRFIGALNQQP